MNRIRTITLASTALAAALVLAGCAPQQSTMPGTNHESGMMSSSESADFNDADAMFATMMIPHHEQAIEMADAVLTKEDVDARVTDLATKIKEAQGPEIETMQGWLQDWGVADDSDSSDGMGHGDGMMSEDDMAALDATTGPEASRVFLEQMIMHHEGAIEMAQAEIDAGQNPDAVALANKIVEDQTAEIATMQDLLDQL
ncbi:DUF305 domain-containing protein [Microbacterium sp. SS28]|uniref:DUF305 domain-containing protein n=1 Tax=Microbacterium sp. SS28 TaxID=2919948 RepID=UPI001FAAA4C8|nr:DUF305 domain-containing protein [Microbacterium sp. SS28]